jgi:hypothetical protein
MRSGGMILGLTFKTNCAKAGIDKVYHDTIVGHSLSGMDIHCIKPNDADLRRAMDVYTKWLDEKHDANVYNAFTN